MRTEEPADAAAIRTQSQAFAEAFNKKDAKVVSEFWTNEGEYISGEGARFATRETIEKGYAQFFKTNPDAKLKLSIDSIRLLSAGAAIEDGQSMVEFTKTGSTEISRYTAVHVKSDGKWKMASLRDYSETSSIGDDNVADLEWLIGNWVAEEHGVKTESTCRWLAGKNFVERQYSTKTPDGKITSGLQIIGWDQQVGSIRSWNFSPDGGNATGIWSPIEGGWSAEVQGTTGAGITTSAVNILKRLDDNAYSWQSVQRKVGGEDLPDTDEVVIKRQRTTAAKK